MGALYIDVAKELQKHGLQFYVNIELGNLTMGAAACTHTKDASFKGEFGQVCSYAVGFKAVRPNGKILVVGEDQPELLQMIRTSFGLPGLVHEVTFKVKQLKPMALLGKHDPDNRFLNTFFAEILGLTNPPPRSV